MLPSPSSSSSSLPSLLNRGSLRFRKSEGSNADGEEVLRTLRREGSSISELLCEEISIRDEDVAEMEQLLIQYHKAIHLSALELPSNGLTMAAGRPLASIVTAQHETLMKLDLSNNPLTSVGLSELISSLTSDSSETFPRLQVLNLTGTQLGPRSAPMLASLIRNNRSIHTLLLGHNALGTKPIKAIAPMLTENSTLQTLDISYNAIKPKGAKFLADALKPNDCLKSNLRSLDITCNKLAPLGMQSLCEMLVVNRTIQELKCTSNNLEEEGAAYLANVLQFNYTLSVLDVESNQIGPVGASVLMDHLLEKNRTLESLNLAWNGVGSNVAEELAQVLKRNEVLTNVNLKGNGITTDGILALAEALLYNNSLTKLDVSHNRFDKYGAFALTNAMGKPTCPMEPQNLVWDHNPSLSEDGVASLKRIPQLRRNRVHWLDRLIGDLGEGNLHNINLTQRNVADEEVLLLAEAMHSCKQAKLRTFPFIRTMFLAGPRLTSRSLIPFFEACLPSPAKVMRLYLQDCSHMEEESIPIIAVNLPRSKSLEVLCLNNCSVTSRGAALLARGLNLNTTLRRLNLNHNEIGDAGLVELAAVLPHQTLKALSVNDNKITDASMSAIGLAQLQELHLNRNSITDRGALAFSQTIDETTCCLTFLDLQFNQVTKKGGDTLKIFLPETIPGSVIVDY